MQRPLNYTFLFNRIAGRFLTIIVPFFLFCSLTHAQDRLKTPIKLRVEDGNMDEVSVVMKNNTTGETNTIPGISKFDLDLKINCDYVISFSKPGYITKKIALNTSAPADRVSQGFYPFNFEVVLFKQYDGVNIVIFNQPVGKISYNRLVDDFDYDTDYTKQIQSALKTAEDEIKKKQMEARSQAEADKKEAEKQKSVAAAEAKEAAKAAFEAEKKLAEENRLQAIQAAKEKKAEEEQRKLEAKANVEQERQRALAQMEEEERAKAKANEEEEQRRKAGATAGNDTPVSSKPSGSGDENKAKRISGSGSEGEPVAASSGSGDEMSRTKAGKGSGTDDNQFMIADANKRNDKGISKATSTSGSDDSPDAVIKTQNASPASVTASENFEVLPDISVEEITESNRTVTKVTVRKAQKETIFSKVQYTWGGIYYFRQNMSISETLYFMNTGRR